MLPLPLSGFVETSQPIRILRERLWQNVDRDVPTEYRVARAIDLAHAATAKQCQDFVSAEAGAGAEGQLVGVAGLYRGQSVAQRDFRGWLQMR